MFELDFAKYDPSNMHKVYDNWPKIASEAYNSDIPDIPLNPPNHIVFAGMGGSGSIGDLFSAIFSKTNIHVDVVKGYHLPNSISKDTLVIPVSISGNSIETMTILKRAHEKNLEILAVSSGGKIEEYCNSNKINYINLKKIHSSRASFMTYVFGLIKTMQNILPFSRDQINESIDSLKQTGEKINSSNLSESNYSLNLARWITTIPVIYYPWGLQAAAVRFKNSFQENSKSHALAEDIIEACHNGIVAWEKPSNIQPILLRGKDDYFKTKERWEIIKEYFTANNIEFWEISSNHNGILSKLINLIYELDYATIYYSILNSTNPSPVRSIDFIKSKI